MCLAIANLFSGYRRKGRNNTVMTIGLHADGKHVDIGGRQVRRGRDRGPTPPPLTPQCGA